ncbi:MAG: AEC family transporter [Oscillospiraceae bacterium]|nr:AEC family transporter [Oscillospiraceae bacterium]
MAQVFSATLGAMLTMLICMLVGFVLRTKKIEPENTDSVFSRFLSFVVAPAMNFNSFLQNFNLQSLKENYTVILFSLLIAALAVIIATFLSRVFVKEGYAQGVYKYAIAFANFSYMGTAVVLSIFGEEMLYYYLLFTTPMNIIVYTWGMTQLIPGKKGFKAALVRISNPTTVAVLLGVFAGLLNLKAYIPGFITGAFSSLGNCMGPISMVLTGYVIGMFDIKKALTDVKIYIVSALRLILFPALYCGLLMLLGASNTVVIVALIAYAMPLGLNTVVFPAAYGADTSVGASMALISNVLCIVTFPVMYALLTTIIK